MELFFYIITIVGLIFYMIKTFLREKGKNLATKQDIADITQKIERVKNEYKIKFDEIQKKNEVFADLIKQAKQRYSSKQFDLYNELWHSLIDLKITADNLWESISKKDLKKFANEVYNAKAMIERSTLLIEEEHYIKLMQVIEKFESFEFGKKKLYKLKTASLNNQNFDCDEIFYVIQKNS